MATLQLLVAGHVPLSLAGLNGIDLDFRSDGAMSPTPHYEMSQSLDSCVQDAQQTRLQHLVAAQANGGSSICYPSATAVQKATAVAEEALEITRHSSIICEHGLIEKHPLACANGRTRSTGSFDHSTCR